MGRYFIKQRVIELYITTIIRKG